MSFLLAATFFTTVLGGTLGTAGGQLLLGAFLLVLPVPEAMVLHGLVQGVANGARAWTFRAHVVRPGLLGYLAGAALATVAAAGITWAPPREAVWIGLGLLPFLARALPRPAWLDASTPRGAALAGLVVVSAQSVVGVAGPLLDLFYTGGRLDRHATVATRAATQAASHAAKVLLFGRLAAPAPEQLPLVVGAMVAAGLGTAVGARLLDRVSEQGWRTWSGRVVLGVGAGHVAAGVLGLAWAAA